MHSAAPPYVNIDVFSYCGLWPGPTCEDKCHDEKEKQPHFMSLLRFGFNSLRAERCLNAKVTEMKVSFTAQWLCLKFRSSVNRLHPRNPQQGGDWQRHTKEGNVWLSERLNRLCWRFCSSIHSVSLQDPDSPESMQRSRICCLLLFPTFLQLREQLCESTVHQDQMFKADVVVSGACPIRFNLLRPLSLFWMLAQNTTGIKDVSLGLKSEISLGQTLMFRLILAKQINHFQILIYSYWFTAILKC